MSLLVSDFYGSTLTGKSYTRLMVTIILTIIFTFATLGVLSDFAVATPRGSNHMTRIAKTDSLSQVKSQVTQAKKDADVAARRYSEAYSSLARVSDELADTQTQLDTAESSISTLENKASKQAKDAYIRVSETTNIRSRESIIDETRREQFLSTVSELSDTQLTSLVSMQEDLRISRDELTQLQEDRRTRLNSLAEEKKSLDTKLANATKAQKDLEVKMARDAKARQAAAKIKNSKSSTAPGTIIGSAKGGSLMCPIQGATAFSDDWGNSRSGGRRHKGTDIFSPRGTPNVAVTDGTVFFQEERLGGVTAWVTGGGYTYYYAHLQSTVGGARSVKRGEIIGYTGSTGNAKGGATHTHFGIHVGGPNGSFMNPYPTLRTIC